MNLFWVAGKVMGDKENGKGISGKIVGLPVFEVSDWMGDRLRICFEYWTGQLRA